MNENKNIVEKTVGGTTFSFTWATLYNIISKIIIILLFLGVMFLVANKIYDLTHSKNQPEAENDMKNPKQVEQIMKEDFGQKVTHSQAERISQTYYDSQPNTIYYKEPDRVVVVPGKDVYVEAENFKKEQKADVVVTTDPQKPDEKPVIDEKKEYVLEQRAYKLYPDNLAGITVYNDKSISVEYDRRVKVFGSDAYVGITAMDDREGGGHNMKYGVKLLIPF